ncbi:hypothetical protein [Streptomyces sp. B6B3]|jgi:hypothetical protein|uniref:hypothetical protein n=1 Tax=Streptomyces sp. B6B3 TaxID=3153570 RepID=UPI00325D3F21
MPVAYAPTPVSKKRLPAGMPREWYVMHNRMIKAMRISIACLESGLYTPQQARNEVIALVAERIGVHPPSAITCRLVRSLLWSSNPQGRVPR